MNLYITCILVTFTLFSFQHVSSYEFSLSNQVPIIINHQNNIDRSSGGVKELDTCLPCVDFFNDYLPYIIKVVGDYGIIDSCSKICNLLNKTVEIDICEGLCDAIGIDKFWKIFLLDDINPIYACQLIKVCTVTKYPAINLISSGATPIDGYAGDSFNFSANFTVINATGVGQFAYIVYYKNQNEYLYSETFENYEPGTYQVSLPFQTVKNATFIDGVYPVDFLICASACDSHTPYSVNLNQSSFYFKLKTSPTEPPTEPPPTISPTSTPIPNNSSSDSESSNNSTSSDIPSSSSSSSNSSSDSSNGSLSGSSGSSPNSSSNDSSNGSSSNSPNGSSSDTPSHSSSSSNGSSSDIPSHSSSDTPSHSSSSSNSSSSDTPSHSSSSSFDSSSSAPSNSSSHSSTSSHDSSNDSSSSVPSNSSSSDTPSHSSSSSFDSSSSASSNSSSSSTIPNDSSSSLAPSNSSSSSNNSSSSDKSSSDSKSSNDSKSSSSDKSSSNENPSSSSNSDSSISLSGSSGIVINININ